MQGEAVQDYLKAIYRLSSGAEYGDGTRHTLVRVGTQELADHLRISPASVSRMLVRLAGMGLVEHEPYHGATLTREGERAALEVVRHHRLLELYLHEKLGYPPDLVHDEAEKLEHYISEEFEARIYEALGRPVVDPHGDVIPTIEGTLPPGVDRSPGCSLAEASVASHVVVRRVPSSDLEKLRYLQGLGVAPGAELVVVEQHPFHGGLRLRRLPDGEEFSLGHGLASEIAVVAECDPSKEAAHATTTGAARE